MTRSDDSNGDDRTGETGPQIPSEALPTWLNTASAPDELGPPSDPIARNPKDTGKPGEAVQAAEVRRHQGVPGPAANVLSLSDRSWGPPQRGATAPATTDLVVSILRFKWTILIVWMLASAPIIAYVWTQTVLLYQARAEIRVRPIIPRLVFRTEDNGMIPLYESFVNTQVSVIRSQTVLQRVLDQNEVRNTRWYKDPSRSLLARVRGSTVPPMERLRDALSVQPRPRTEIIDVRFAAEHASDAKVIADTILGQYMKYLGERSYDTENRLDRQLDEQYNSLKSQIEGSEKTYASLCKSLGTEAPQELVSARRIQLDAMQMRLAELRTRIAVLAWEVNQVTVVDSNGVRMTSTAGAVPPSRYHEDAEWRTLNGNVRSLEHQIANSVYLPTHPAGIRLRKDLEYAQERLQERETQLDEQWQDRLQNAAAGSLLATDTDDPGRGEGPLLPDRELARAREEERLLVQELKQEQDEFNSLFDLAQSLESENNALRQKRELFEAVRQRRDQRNMERNVPGSIEITTAAYSPSRPENDRRVVFSVMGLFAGLGAGGALGFLRASRNQTIYAPKDMPQPAQAPFLGYVPLVNLRKPLGESLYDEIEQKQLLLLESVRVLRTALLSRLSGHSSTTVVVTSANEGTGKSSFTMLLGKSIAQAGRKVLIIDADFHKMTLSRRLNVLDKPGFRESLRDKATESLHVFPTATAGLEVMPAGLHSNGDVAFEEIANGAFRSCLRRLFGQHGYDIILLDTSPILPVADAAILAGQADGAILVEREHVSRRTEVANALIRLSATGGRLLGTVFVGSTEQDRYGSGYGRGYYGKKTKES